MRLSIAHTTRYRFSQPQARLIQLLRLTPSDTDDQTVAAWRIDVDCDARLRDGRDGFGNRTTTLYADGPIEQIEIAVSGEILTGEVSGQVCGTHETLPTVLFLRNTALTPPDPAIGATAAEVPGDPRSALRTLAEMVADRFVLDAGRPRAGMTAAVAWDEPRLTPRDLAHVMIVAARARGWPARYVAGHSLALAEEHDGSTSHAWAEVHLDGIGWIGVDPARGAEIDERYVRVAHGLDFSQAAPVAGLRVGEGREWLGVDVHVERLGEIQ